MHIYIRGFSPGMLGRLHHYSILEYQIISRVSDKLPVAATLFQSSGGSFDTQHRPSMEVPPAKMATAYDKCVLYVQVKVCRCHQKKWGLCNMCKLCYVGVTERNGDTESATSYSNQLFYSPDHVFNWLVISYESPRNRDTLLSALVQQCHMNIHTWVWGTNPM